MVGFTIVCGVLLIGKFVVALKVEIILKLILIFHKSFHKGHVINSVVEKRLNGLFAVIGCILFVVSGALIIDQWHDRSEILFKESKRNALAAGSLMIINGAVFLMDTISIFRT